MKRAVMVVAGAGAALLLRLPGPPLAGATALAQAPAPPAGWSVEDCKACHEKATGPAFARTKHAQADLSCANCHQDVGEHARARAEGRSDGPVPSVKKLTAGALNDDTFTTTPASSQLYSYIAGGRDALWNDKGTLYAFARHLFGADTKLRFRAHFFPFTEPSAEFDFSWKTGWLEWGGCGMIHPRVLLNCGIDPQRWQGFAFGMGLDRPALLRFGLPSLQLLFDGDLRVLEQL